MEFAAKIKSIVKRSLYLIISLLLTFACFSCADDDDFSSSPDLPLTFSSDVVRFDTVFTTIGSATRQFKIYNRNSNSLVIQSIELMNPEKTGFRMNIDGEKGTKLTDMEILKKDSLFGFVEVTVNPQESGNPVLIRDSIKFTTNGNAQYLYLEAIGQDVYIWKKKTIAEDTILTNAKPFLIYDSLVIKKGASLRVKEGVKFFMKKDASVKVHGNILADGTVKNPIVFRGERFDKIEGNVPYDNVPGQWDGICFYPESYDNRLENVHIRNATRGMTFFASDAQYKKAVLDNVIVHNSSEYGVMAVNTDIEGRNCLFTNSRAATLILQGGKYSFLHCTLANYYTWSSRRIATLILSNYGDADVKTPLIECDFTNSIIYGSATNELLLDNDPDSSSDFNYQFRNCLIKSDETDDSHFVNTIWNQNPLFRFLNNDGTYSYNFELQKDSPAIGKADKSCSFYAPADLKGYLRMDDSNPDIGCYEWVE